MKKKFLLAIIPALLAMSSCTYMQSATAVKGNDFLEDCLAHDELFGNAELQVAEPETQREKQPLRASNPGFDPEESFQHPSIGVQTFYDDVNNKVSFRFVAVVHFDNAEALGASSAVWTRCVSKTDCSSYPLNDTTPAPEVTKAYTSLNNNGSIYSITDYNNDHRNEYDQPAGYTHFVVYTLRDIDLSKYAGSDYYVSAYVTMSGAFESSSKAIAIRFDRLKKYSYVQNVGTGYIEGTFSGTPAIIEKTAVNNDSNAASFLNHKISKDDTFVIKAFDGTKLKIRNALNFTGDGNNSGDFFADDNGEIKATYTGTYSLYLNSSHQIYTSATKVVNDAKLYVDVDVYWWHGAWTAVYAYTGDLDDDNGQWFELNTPNSGDDFTTSTKNNFYTEDVLYTSGYDKVAVCRINNDVAFASLPASHKNNGWNNIVYNVTSADIKSNTYEDCVYVYLSEGNLGSSMGSRN